MEPSAAGAAHRRATRSRALGIDLGERRIGVAVGDLQTGSCQPLVTLGRAKKLEGDARTISRLAVEQQASVLVVGLPLDMGGTEGPQATKTREWAVAISNATGLQLRLRDERLTSERAERRIGPPTRGRSGGPPSASARDSYRARVDREAAALILQDEIDATSAEAERGAQ
jgi:putative Holliday junction resolvase